MPTYEYECSGCSHRFERFQSITEGRVRKCPACGALKVKRLLGTGGAILFKGSGFYTTDYRSKEYKERASAEKSPDSKTGSPAASSGSDEKESSPEGEKPSAGGKKE